MNRIAVAKELIKLAGELVAGKDGRFFMEFYKDGKRKRHYFDSLQDAKEAANEIFKITGIIMGIEQEK
jgi:hypothetical protein